MRASSLALRLLLLGCLIGCDGERAQRPARPRPVLVDAGASDAAAPAVAHDNLDVPPGSLDALFASLDAAERGDPGARTLLLFFGDSHTGGDFLTSRLRSTWQQRFGDAGRGLVGAGKDRKSVV